MKGFICLNTKAVCFLLSSNNIIVRVKSKQIPVHVSLSITVIAKPK